MDRELSESKHGGITNIDIVVRHSTIDVLQEGLKQSVTSHHITSHPSISLSFICHRNKQYNKAKPVNRHGNELPEKPTAHQADRPYDRFITIKHENTEQKQTQTRTGPTEQVKIKRLTWTNSWKDHSLMNLRHPQSNVNVISVWTFCCLNLVSLA